MEFLDYFARHAAKWYECVKAAGFAGVIRYVLLPEDDPSGIKGIDAAELQCIHAAGLYLALVYETTGGAGMGPGYFTKERGRSDATKAVMRAREIGYPTGYVIFYAADTAITAGEAVEYWNGVNEVHAENGWPYRVGEYGDAGLISAPWPNMVRWLTPAWSGGLRPACDVYQYDQRDVCGTSCDINTVYGEPTWAWAPGADEEETMTPEELYAKIAPLLQERIVARQEDTNIALKQAIAALAANDATEADRVLRELAARIAN